MGIEKYYINFEELKVGDSVWSLELGDSSVDVIDKDVNNKYPIRLIGVSYTREGKRMADHSFPSLFKSNPFINLADGFKERVMLVSDDNKNWKERVVFAERNGQFIAWNSSDNIEDSKKQVETCNWRFAKEIEEPKVVELTMEEIAKLANCKVEELKIIK